MPRQRQATGEDPDSVKLEAEHNMGARPLGDDLATGGWPMALRMTWPLRDEPVTGRWPRPQLVHRPPTFFVCFGRC